MATHRFEGLTGDVRVRVEAESLPALFAEAGRAVAELMGRADGAPGEWEAIEVEAPDLDALLVEWLNELVIRTEVEKQLFVDVEVDQVTDRRVDGRVRGRAIVEPRTPIKAATLHGLQVTERLDGVEATVVLDI